MPSRMAATPTCDSSIVALRRGEMISGEVAGGKMAGAGGLGRHRVM